MKVRRVLHALSRPRVVLSLLLAAALFWLAFSLGNLGQVMGRLHAVPIPSLVLVLGLAFAYVVLKGLQLRLLLNHLGVRPSWRRFALAFSVGELAVTLPFGIFAQNWVLTGDRDTRFGHSSAATVAVLLAEVLLVLVWLAIIGIPGWTPLRPVAALVALILIALLFAVRRIEACACRLARRVQRPWLRRAVKEFVGLSRGLRELGDWRVLATSGVLTALYLTALMSAFLVMGRAMGLHGLDSLEASTIYAFSLAAIFLCAGLFGQVGTLEVLGMGAARAWGFGYTDGLALMLGFRLAWTCAIWVWNAPLAWACRRALQADDAAESVNPQSQENA